MSIALSQVLQRVFVRDSDGGEDKWLPERVHAVLRVIFDQARDDAAELPINLFVAEIGRRCRKNPRTVQTALREAEDLGIIKRIRTNVGRCWHGNAQDREIGATWPILVHWAVIEASKDRCPYRGPRINDKVVDVPVVYPQHWEKPEGFGGETLAGANAAGKKGTGKDHYPPKTRPGSTGSSQLIATASRPGRPKRPGPVLKLASSRSLVIPAGVSARGGSETGPGSTGSSQLIATASRPGRPKRPVTVLKLASSRSLVIPAGVSVRGGSENVHETLGEDIDSSPEGRAKSFAALRAFLGSKAETDDRYWTWMATSAAEAGWVEKTDGAWKGAKSGDLHFVFQRRGKESGERAGTFNGKRVSLSQAARRSAPVLAQAVKWQGTGTIEVGFQPDGDHPLLLIDDLKREHLALFEGWSGIAILETSPDNFQVSLMAPRCLRHDETVAAQRALARRCGLTLAAVQARQLRRFPGSVNNKPSLEVPFVARLVTEPLSGTITVDQLSELLAEDAADSAAQTGQTVAQSKVVKRAKKELIAASGVGRPMRSESERDWHWLLVRMDSVGGRNRDRLVAELEARAADRRRQGKVANDPDHRRYAELTVDNALAYLAKRRR